MKRFLLPQALLSWLYSDGEVAQYARAMEAGFGKVSAEKLEAIKFRLTPIELSDAAWALAYWYRLNEQYERALDQLLLRRIVDPQVLDDRRHIVVEVDILLALGRLDAAKSVVNDAIERIGEVPELCFSAANLIAASPEQVQSDGDRLRLSWLNKPFINAGFAPIELIDPSSPLAIDNIAAPTARTDPRSGEARVSVLMPAYNSERTIATAMESVLRQTWTNLELIVVDDGSDDGTWSVIECFAKRDARVVPIRHSHNHGAYAARNTALSRATGEVVTVHDSDDWSHPEKLALQVNALMKSGRANLTKQIRVLHSIRFYVKPDGATILNCYPSLMIKRNILAELGAWDESRMGADGELWERLLIKNPKNKVVLNGEVPLSFHLFREDSLTATGLTGVGTLHYGARCQYMGAYAHWHKLELEKSEPDLVIRRGQRRFPVPHICRPRPTKRLDYDILLVSDFSLPGGTTSSNVNILRAGKELGLRCTCFHWPRIEFATRAMNPKIRQVLHEAVADNLVAGERVRCKVVIVNHPPVLNQLPDTLPQVETEGCVVVVNQTPRSRTKGGQELYDLTNTIANARIAFGVSPTLAPISPLVRRFLKLAAPAMTFTEMDWTPLIDLKQYGRHSPGRDGFRLPVVGRHGRDSPDKWPTDRETLRLAYCAGTNLEVRILGGALMARRVLGKIPSNWTVYPYDFMTVQDFLRGLDFFVHFPHEHWIEAFGRAPMEAMAAGIPVILPPVFQETFGDAALYAEPAEVRGTIQALWNDEHAYLARAQAGRDFVLRRCGYDQLAKRLQDLPAMARQDRAAESALKSVGRL